MKKTRMIVAATLAFATLFAPAAAANANTVDCNATAIWTQDESGVVKKWSKRGELLGAVQGIPASGDIAISSDLSKIVVVGFSGGSSNLTSYSATTGALVEGPTPITGASVSAFGSGIISGGRLLAETGTQIYSVDTTTFVASEFADLTSADASVPVGNRGGFWSIAGDLLQLPDGDILAIANNFDVYSGGVILVRITATEPRQLTVVGVVETSSIYGAARAGDEIYLASGDGKLFRVASIPSSASLLPVAVTEVTLDGEDHVFFGAAGSNDSTEGSVGCTFATLPPAAPAAAAPAAAAPAAAAPAAAAPAAAPALARTGADFWSTAGLLLPALALIGLGVARIASRRINKA